MQSLRTVFRIGNGPSSSHTMAPRRASEIFKARVPSAVKFRVTLYGSLAATGRGHLTDKVIREVIPNIKIVWKPDQYLPQHPNGMLFEGFDESCKLLDTWLVFSIGGGSLSDDTRQKGVFPQTTLDKILAVCEKEGIPLWQYVFKHDLLIEHHLKDVWRTMNDAMARGIETEGVLPGRLKVDRKAASFYVKARSTKGFLHHAHMMFAYALAVSEENAAGGVVVTAPTCGSCAVVPAVLKELQRMYDVPDIRIIRALATAGLIGVLVKKNGSVSGAEVGCQGEIGVACAMGSAAAAQLMGGTNHQIEYAAEMGLEHHLGLTCDPVAGLVQIPCIERNALGSVRAMECAAYALLSDGRHRISFDQAVTTMLETGRDLQSKYRETSKGGLARRRARLK